MVPFFINSFTLDIHHIIIFQQSFTDPEVIFFHFLLSSLDRFCDHGVLDDFPFLDSEPVHDLCDALRPEHTHEVIFQGNEKL